MSHSHRQEEENAHETLLLNLLVCCVCLVCNVALARFGWKGLSTFRTKKISELSQSLLRKHESVQRTYNGRSYLHWIAFGVLGSGVLYQLTLFEHYVVMRILMRGFNRKSPLFSMCRLNQYLIWQIGSFQMAFLVWFWLELLISTFRSGMSDIEISGVTVNVSYAFLALILLLSPTVGIVNAVRANDIEGIKSTDVNVYTAVNDNLTKCHMQGGESTLGTVLITIVLCSGLLLTAILARMFWWRLRRIAANRALSKRMAHKQLAVANKSATLLIVSFAVTLLTMALILATGIWVLTAVSSVLSTAAVVFFFQFSQHYYQRFCGCFDTLVSFATNPKDFRKEEEEEYLPAATLQMTKSSLTVV